MSVSKLIVIFVTVLSFVRFWYSVLADRSLGPGLLEDFNPIQNWVRPSPTCLGGGSGVNFNPSPPPPNKNNIFIVLFAVFGPHSYFLPINFIKIFGPNSSGVVLKTSGQNNIVGTIYPFLGAISPNIHVLFDFSHKTQNSKSPNKNILFALTPPPPAAPDSWVLKL